jgi:hypothetical protein
VALEEIEVTTSDGHPLGRAGYRHSIPINIADVNIYGRIYEASFDLATIRVKVWADGHISCPPVWVNILCSGRI